MVSNPLPKSSVGFLGTDLDQIGSSSDSKRMILLCMNTLYRIAENFQGRKLSRILQFGDDSRKFSPRNLGVWYPLGLQKRAICESFLHENHIFHQSAKVFSLKSFPLYGSVEFSRVFNFTKFQLLAKLFQRNFEK